MTKSESNSSETMNTTLESSSPINQKSIKMNSKETLTLIDGTFKAEEAKEILMGIFSAKIKFHDAKNFSHKIRYGSEDEFSQGRIAGLKSSIDKLQQIVKEAEAGKKKMVITSEIHISLIDG